MGTSVKTWLGHLDSDCLSACTGKCISVTFNLKISCKKTDFQDERSHACALFAHVSPIREFLTREHQSRYYFQLEIALTHNTAS